jgi:hypothetical protein
VIAINIIGLITAITKKIHQSFIYHYSAKIMMPWFEMFLPIAPTP